jgi:hypothetical protein
MRYVDLEFDNHVQARAEYKSQLRQLLWASYKQHELSADEQSAMFREIIGEIEEAEDMEEYHNDD